MSVVSTLRGIPLFSQLREGDLSRIAQAVRMRSYPKNSVIVFEDDPGDALYVVAQGQVKVVLIAEDGREVILAIRGPGDFFGEMSLIDDEPRSAHVIAMEDSDLVVLRRDDFRRCLYDMPDIALGLLRALCRRVREADEKIGGLVLLDVPGRVARLLLQLADENDGIAITKRVTHHTIAQMVGSSRETVSRAMSNLASSQVIEVNRRRITIRDRGALEAAAGQGHARRQRPEFDGRTERRQAVGGGAAPISRPSGAAVPLRPPSLS